MINSTELRRALRALKARPWFTIGATVSLAFGIGANTTVFTGLYDPAWKVELEVDAVIP